MQANDGYRLIVRRGPQPNQVYELTGEVSNVGRDITNNIVINDREVSRHHLRLMRGSEGYTVEDLGSTNGTFVNGKRVTGATPLKNGDMLGLGETVTLLFEAGRPGTVAPSAQQPYEQAPPPQQPQQQPQPEERYRPPEQAENPYAPPQPEPYQQPQQGYQQPQEAYAPQPYAQQAPEQPYGEQQPQYDYNNPAVAPAYGPPPPGYDYDPYAMREEEGGGLTQWLLIGCLGLLLVCCCATVIAAVAVDSLCLYDSIPGLVEILNAVGIQVQCLP